MGEQGAREREERRRAPLTPAAFHVLLSLAGEERHGYGIMREVERRSSGEERLGPGTLYRTIGRLLDDGLIEESGERPDPERDDERRRYYRITEKGVKAAGTEAQRLEALVGAARDRRLLPGYPGAPLPGGA